jgi:hypothetical protein
MKFGDRTVMAPHPYLQAPPDPNSDWCCQKLVAKALGISQQAASAKARSGELRHFEHGNRGCGRRKYSKALIERELRRRWEKAIEVQDRLMEIGEA